MCSDFPRRCHSMIDSLSAQSEQLTSRQVLPFRPLSNPQLDEAPAMGIACPYEDSCPCSADAPMAMAGGLHQPTIKVRKRDAWKDGGEREPPFQATGDGLMEVGCRVSGVVKRQTIRACLFRHPRPGNRRTKRGQVCSVENFFLADC